MVPEAILTFSEFFIFSRMKDCSLTIGKHFEICVIEVLFERTNLLENGDMILVATISKQIIRCYILSHHV